MSVYSDFQRWLAECRHVSSRGTTLTQGDLTYCGLQDYYSARPCPNGLPIDTRTPDQVPSHRARIERARRDIAERQREMRVADTAAGLSADDVSQFISEIRTWVRSRQWQVVGSTESKPVDRD